MNFQQPESTPYEMFVALERDYTSFTRATPPLATSPYAPLDPKYLVWPGTEPDSAERVNAWAQTPLDALTDRILDTEEDGALADFFSARKEFLGKSVEHILSQIYERENLTSEHKYQIDIESCRAKTRLFEVDDWLPGLNQNVDKVRSNAEKDLAGMEREKRMEETACWRDVSRLREQLQETMKEWSEEKRRHNLISGQLE